MLEYIFLPVYSPARGCLGKWTYAFAPVTRTKNVSLSLVSRVLRDIVCIKLNVNLDCELNEVVERLCDRRRTKVEVHDVGGKRNYGSVLLARLKHLPYSA